MEGIFLDFRLTGVDSKSIQSETKELKSHVNNVTVDFNKYTYKILAFILSFENQDILNSSVIYVKNGDEQKLISPFLLASKEDLIKSVINMHPTSEENADKIKRCIGEFFNENFMAKCNTNVVMQILLRQEEKQQV